MRAKFNNVVRGSISGFWRIQDPCSLRIESEVKSEDSHCYHHETGHEYACSRNGNKVTVNDHYAVNQFKEKAYSRDQIDEMRVEWVECIQREI